MYIHRADPLPLPLFGRNISWLPSSLCKDGGGGGFLGGVFEGRGGFPGGVGPFIRGPLWFGGGCLVDHSGVFVPYPCIPEPGMGPKPGGGGPYAPLYMAGPL